MCDLTLPDLIDFKVSKCNSDIRLVKFNSTTCIRKQSRHSVRHEYSILASLNNPHIIKPINLESSTSFLMELGEKGDLNRKKPTTDPETLVNIFKQMCQAVLYLHNKKIVHLDLKLENFVESSDGTIKLIDFEHALLHPDSIKETLGTNIYNSPERSSGNYNGVKADIYSLGICLTGLMTGFIPVSRSGVSFPSSSSFISNKDLFWDNLEIHCCKTSSLFEGLDDRAVDLINQMVDIDPSKRPELETVLLHDFFEL